MDWFSPWNERNFGFSGIDQPEWREFFLRDEVAPSKVEVAQECVNTLRRMLEILHLRSSMFLSPGTYCQLTPKTTTDKNAKMMTQLHLLDW